MSAGKQAEVLNILLEDLLEGHAVSETKLKEVLGHTPIQVCMCSYSLSVVGSFPLSSSATEAKQTLVPVLFCTAKELPGAKQASL